MIKNYIELAFDTVKKNRMRSFLTSLGVAIGVASIMVILSLTGGIQNIIDGRIGGNIKGGVAVVMSKAADEGDVSTEVERGILEEIGRIPGVKKVVPVKVGFEQVRGDETQTGVQVIGTDQEFAKIHKIKMKSGQFLEDEKTGDFAVLGIDLARKLFGTTDATGRILEMSGRQFLVNGVMDEVNVQNLSSDLTINNAMLVSEKKLDRKILRGITEVDEQTSVEKVRDEITKINGGEKIVFKTEKEIIGQVSEARNVAVVMLGVISGVALFIGGIGVMNIMLVAAGERTHEIGIRKAVGATGKNILAQFMVESVILAVLGGVLGILLGLGVIYGMGLFIKIEPFMNVEIAGLAFLAALVVGVVFGVYPAGVAAGKSPIGALKHYR